MLKEYLSEAASLLTEVVLGRPVPAKALQCNWGAKCSTCGACGQGKAKYYYWCYECGTCVPGGCGWCNHGCMCGDWC